MAPDLDAALVVLRAAGARFVLLHGSRAGATPRSDSDLDLAAEFGRAVGAWELDLPPHVDLLVLDGAPLELSGRVALRGQLLWEGDPVARVRWQATTRKLYLDELPRRDQARRDFAAARAAGG